MIQRLDPDELRALPLAERLKLIEDLWDSIAADPDALPLPDWHRAEIDRRLDNLDAGASEGASWDEVRRRITGKR
jgi:putative addiction module component (TIGR02574 family)